MTIHLRYNETVVRMQATFRRTLGVLPEVDETRKYVSYQTTAVSGFRVRPSRSSSSLKYYTTYIFPGVCADAMKHCKGNTTGCALTVVYFRIELEEIVQRIML